MKVIKTAEYIKKLAGSPYAETPLGEYTSFGRSFKPLIKSLDLTPLIGLELSGLGKSAILGESGYFGEGIPITPENMRKVQSSIRMALSDEVDDFISGNGVGSTVGLKRLPELMQKAEQVKNNRDQSLRYTEDTVEEMPPSEYNDQFDKWR